TEFFRRSCVTLKESIEIYSYIEKKEIRVIAYLLGELTSNSTQMYQKYCPFVEFAKFNYNDYPGYVRKLKHYRWKPLIIAEYLKANDIVLWFDTSVIFKRSKTGFKKIVETLNNKHKTCGFRILSKTHHSIMAATDPKMYDYFHVNNKILHLNMISTTVFIASKTSKAVNVLEKVVKCALAENCMGPPNSTIHCVDKVLHKGLFAGCHRYDQSALALSLAQCSLKTKDYLGVSDLVSVKRIENYDPGDWIEVKKRFSWVEVNKDMK
ncbi:hypothetical protein FO519_009857, partial [Halicephalobus sp. NKZ332]